MALLVFTLSPALVAEDRLDSRNDVAAADLQRIETIARVSPAVVCIYDVNRLGGGSGVIIDPDGYGLTNYHVVAGMLDTRRGLGGIAGQPLYDLEVLGIDPTGDVAMFRLHGKERFDYAELGDSDAVGVGDTAIAMGNPFILSEDQSPTVTAGIVSGVHRYQWGVNGALTYSDCIQTDAAINPGNSGGPLFDSYGRVIGINGRISASSQVRGKINVGLGYAISINQIKRFIPGLRKGLLVRHGTLQATVNRDLLFNEMFEDGPAWKAGIRLGDRLLKFAGRDINSANEFASVLGTYPEGWLVDVEFERNGDVQHVSLRLEGVSVRDQDSFSIDADVTRAAANQMVADLEPSEQPHAATSKRAIDIALARTVKLYGLGAGPQQGYGSGTLVSPDGRVLTVDSILIDATDVRAVTPDGTLYSASVVARDADLQLALLQLHPPDDPEANVTGLDAFTEGASDHLLPGDRVIAAGNPFKVADGAEAVSVAQGVYSGPARLDARRRRQDYPYRGPVLAIDAVTSNPGAPGGPLVDLDGNWVGLIGRVVVSNHTLTQFNYAVPAEVCLGFIRSCEAGATKSVVEAGTLDAAHLGIDLFEMGYKKKLVFVERVRADSPAARAGLRADDLIVNFMGRHVPDLDAFNRTLASLQPGDVLDLVVLRDEEHRRIRIESAAAEPSANEERTAHVDPRGLRSAARLPPEDERRSTTHQAIARAAPFVVRIETVGGAQPVPDGDSSITVEPGDAEERAESPFRDDLGSGFQVADGPTTGIIYSADGYIVTSSFNFVRDPVAITVILADQRRFLAHLVARDRVRKLALLKIDANDLPVPAWADAGEARVGQSVLALGRVLNARQANVTVGIVSALDRMQGNAIQTDAKLSPANYGGPLVGLDGRVLGICAPMAQRPGELAGIEFYDAGIGFAVPRHRVDEIVSQLKQGRSFYRGWLGFRTDPSAVHQVQIGALADPSPLRSAGASPGDVITDINGQPVRNFGNLMQSLYMLPAGTRVRLTLQREDEEFDITISLARADELGPLSDEADPAIPADPTPEPLRR